MTDSSSTHWPRVLVLWLCGVLAAFQFAKIAVALAPLQAHYAVTAASVGWVLSIPGTVGLLLGVMLGLLAPRWGYRRLLLGGLALGAAVNAAQCLLPPMQWLLASRVVEGASHLAVVVATPVLMVAASAPHHRAMVMGLWSTFMGVGFALAGAFGSALVAHAPVEAVFALHGAALVLVACLVLWVQAPDVPGVAPRMPLATLWRHHIQIYTVWTSALPGLCFLGYTAMAMALLSFMPQANGKHSVGLATTLPLMGIAGTLFAGWVAQHHVPPLRLARYAFVGVVVCALGWGAGQWANADTTVLALLLLFAAGVAGASAFVLIPALNHHPAEQARASGALAQMGNLGATLGPPVFAWCMAQWGAQGLVVCVLSCASMGLGWIWWGTSMQRRAV